MITVSLAPLLHLEAIHSVWTDRTGGYHLLREVEGMRDLGEEVDNQGGECSKREMDISHVELLEGFSRSKCERHLF